MTYQEIINFLKEYLDSKKIPYIDVGVAGDRIIVRVKFKEYAEAIPDSIDGTSIAVSVAGPTQQELREMGEFYGG